MKISELSKELGATSKDIIALANDLGIECKAATKNLSDEEMQTVKNAFLKKAAPAKEEKPAKTEKKESTKFKGQLLKCLMTRTKSLIVKRHDTLRTEYFMYRILGFIKINNTNLTFSL